MSRLRRGLLGLVVSFALMGIFSTQGYAYLGQYPYDNSDPNATGCSTAATGNANSLWVDGPDGEGGWLNERFSDWNYVGANCATAWAKFTCERNTWWGAGCYNYWIIIQRGNDNAYISSGFIASDTPVGSSIFTNQLYDGGSLYSRACISWNPDLFPYSCTAWY